MSISPPETTEEWVALWDKHWAELNPDLRQRAITVLRNHYDDATWEFVRDAHERDPGTWWMSHGWHGLGGQRIRTTLRESGLGDDHLPGGTWEDFYIPVVEAAAGVRE